MFAMWGRECFPNLILDEGLGFERKTHSYIVREIVFSPTQILRCRPQIPERGREKDQLESDGWVGAEQAPFRRFSPRSRERPLEMARGDECRGKGRTLIIVGTPPAIWRTRGQCSPNVPQMAGGDVTCVVSFVEAVFVLNLVCRASTSASSISLRHDLMFTLRNGFTSTHFRARAIRTSAARTSAEMGTESAESVPKRLEDSGAGAPSSSEEVRSETPGRRSLVVGRGRDPELPRRRKR